MSATPYKLYVETHIRKSVTRRLHEMGVDVVRADEVGMANATDLVHLEYSTREGRVLVTCDDDLLSLAAHWRSEGREHAGIMFVQPEISQAGKRGIGPLVRALFFYHEAVAAGAASIEQEIYNQVKYISLKEWS